MIYLYVKEHAVTGLKYFGKTIRNDPFKYKGSGKYWTKHLKKHGRKILTTGIWGFDSVDDCYKFALEFSIRNDIVESKSWANLKYESIDGGRLGEYTAERYAKINESRRQNGKPNPLKGVPRLPSTKLLISLKTTGRKPSRGTTGMKMSEETKARMSDSRRKWSSSGAKGKTWTRSDDANQKLAATASGRRRVYDNGVDGKWHWEKN